MRRYRVRWKQITNCWATVDAESPSEAIKKAKSGDYNDDCDTKAGEDVKNSYVCEDLVMK